MSLNEGRFQNFEIDSAPPFFGMHICEDKVRLKMVSSVKYSNQFMVEVFRWPCTIMHQF